MSESPLESPQDLGGPMPQPVADADAAYVISRFVLLRRGTTGWIAESLVSGRVLELPSPTRWTLFLSFAKPTRPASLIAGMSEEQASAVLRFVGCCHRMQLLARLTEEGAAEEEAALVLWEPHDLYFHTRSRRGRHHHPVGATYPLKGVVAPLPTVKPRSEATPIELERPRERFGEQTGLLATLERRRSLYSTAPVTRRALAEFLYLTCRISNPQAVRENDGLARKVYPSGGSLHSLEVYLAAHRCTGLEPGLYHYRPLDHALSRIAADGPGVESLLLDAQRATGGQLEDLPSVLFVFSSRFGRVRRKYQSLAYSAVLKEVGALFQTMYVVATAMDLAPCAIGAGNSDAFSRVAGANPWEEPSVGELILGGRP